MVHLLHDFITTSTYFSQASCHKERHVSQKAVSFIHNVLTEVLTSWAELPHFHFNEALFRPFEHIMQLELCDEDVQDQVKSNLQKHRKNFCDALHSFAWTQGITLPSCRWSHQLENWWRCVPHKSCQDGGLCLALWGLSTAVKLRLRTTCWGNTPWVKNISQGKVWKSLLVESDYYFLYFFLSLHLSV